MLLVPVVIALARRDLPDDSNFILALVLYSTIATLVLLVWPGGIATRYAMPANLALAVVAGILFERWWFSRQWLIAVANTAVFGISTALVIFGWIVMPMAPLTFSHSKIEAQVIAGVRRIVPGTLYVTTSMSNLNVLAYVPAPVRRVSLSELERLSAPSLALMTLEEMSAVAGARPDYRIIEHAKLSGRPSFVLAEIQPN